MAEGVLMRHNATGPAAAALTKAVDSLADVGGAGYRWEPSWTPDYVYFRGSQGTYALPGYETRIADGLLQISNGPWGESRRYIAMLWVAEKTEQGGTKWQCVAQMRASGRATSVARLYNAVDRPVQLAHAKAAAERATRMDAVARRIIRELGA